MKNTLFNDTPTARSDPQMNADVKNGMVMLNGTLKPRKWRQIAKYHKRDAWGTLKKLLLNDCLKSRSGDRI